MRGMRHAIAAMAAQGNNLIVDEVMIGTDKIREYRTLWLRSIFISWVFSRPLMCSKRGNGYAEIENSALRDGNTIVFIVV